MKRRDHLPPTRRGFLKLIGGVALLPVVGINACSKENGSPPPATPSPGSAPAADPQAAAPASAPAPSGGLPHVAEDDPTAQAVGYRHDAADVDTARFPQRAAPQAANQFCSNCALFQASGDEQWAGCTLFAGRAVNAKGWCSAWVLKS